MAAPPLKKKKKSWDPEDMKSALEAISRGSKIKTAARNYNVPETTIRDRLKMPQNYDPPMGRKATFSKEQEQEFVAFLTLMAKKFYGITQQRLRKLAYEFAQLNNIKNIFSEEKGMAGKCWVYAFLKRNPGLSLRLPEPTSLNRILGFNKPEISIFFANLENLIVKYNYTANRIFNVDETGITTVQKPGKIYAPTGLKQVGKATSGERGQNVTVVCAFSATGIYVPPMFIYPRLRIKATLSAGGPSGSVYDCSKSGWINEELFVKWLQHFAKQIGAHVHNRTLLVLDNHSSHQSLRAYEICREHGIDLLSLPPHTSHRMQPLDVTFYGPLKTAYSRECDLYMKMHPFEKITHDNLASIFNKAYIRVATMEKAVKGFEVTGIYPMNPHIFDDDEVLISDPIVEDLTSSTQANRHEENEPVASSSTQMQVQVDQEDSTRSNTPSPSIFCLDQHFRSENTPVRTPTREINETQNQSNEIKDIESTTKNSTTKNNQSASAVDVFKPSTSKSILEELSPVPQKVIKIKRRGKKQHSVILTATPMKEQFEEKEKRKNSKEIKKLEKVSKGKNVKGKNLAKGKSCKRRVLRDSENSEGARKSKNNDTDNLEKDTKKLGTGKKGKLRTENKAKNSKRQKKAKLKSIEVCSSSSDDVPLSEICNDDEDDDIENDDLCAVCGEFGQDREMWFRCCSCSNWVHKECSSKDVAENFLGDFCEDYE